MTTKKMKATIASYNDEILCDILSRLPLKSLIRFKCVSRSWQNLIEKDQWLTDLHHSRQLQTSRHLFFSISKTISRTLIMMVFHLEESVKFESYCKSNLCTDRTHKEITTAATTIQPIANSDMLACEHVQKPINGMVCLIDKIERKDSVGRDHEVKEDHAACLYNAITGEATPWIRSTYLAQIQRWCDLSEVEVSRIYEFGFDPTTKEYKVICFWSIDGWELQECEGCGDYKACEDDEGYWGYYRMCEILTLGKDTAWRRIDKAPRSDNYHKEIHGSVYVNGYIYWIIYKGLHPVLVAFDVKSEEYRLMPDLDLVAHNNSFHLMELDGRLAIEKSAGNNIVDLWILDVHYGKDLSIRNTSKEIIMLPLCWRCRNVHCHSVAGTEYLILECYSGRGSKQKLTSVHSYNRKNKTFSKIEITRDGSPLPSSLGVYIGHPSCNSATYVESLLSLQRSYRPAMDAPDSSSSNNTARLSENL